ncbi:ABC transporter ATP-binding protein [Candidatus Aquiluna sp. UB-MaderosW2red]|jgi:iron complex transport system ATP-binding protein|uniref:ABC transporter ATP-binding protein n=1 Tax=Candidatus Aquiluna sp. UB-MaderosW2red TaxID=1855377 RepID=UPI000875EABC|nr:ABC transporter ATP-binding protein [Candidatus Aquiluna sp. UB-MaderosW2red]SCX08156.1 iron complex transport system ATP-binding protein [Candidatus Aquiluna sp. UB-MaderosW2red]
MFDAESKIAAQALSAGYSADEVIHNIDLNFKAGSVTAIIGANGAGKSSLLKALARKIKSSSGAVLLDGLAITSLTKGQLENKVGLLGTIPVAKRTETVFDLVARSAMAANGISRVSPRLKQEIDLLLERTGLSEKADQKIGELSSGFRQVAVIAAALVKNPEVLLLDEPTNSLDYSHQLQVINLLSSLKRERSMTIIAVIHDLNLAARFADTVVILKDGHVIAQGEPKEVITPNNLARAFNILARVLEDPIGKTQLVIPIRQLG